MESIEVPSTATAPADELSVMERLRLGHGLLSPKQFHAALVAGDLEVWQLPNDCYALMQWGECALGRTANIITTVGRMADADDAFAAIERGARINGAAVIMSVGAQGWTRKALQHGYDVVPRILMTKVLHNDPATTG